MDALAYYSIAFGALWVAAALPRFIALFQHFVVPRFRCHIAKVRYRRIQGFTPLHLLSGFTPLELILLAMYVAGNGVAVAMQTTRGATVASSTALAASINLIPLLLGGRTSRFADVAGFSRPSYYVAHHWIGRVVILEALVHTGLGLVPVVQSRAFEPLAISGCLAAGSFLAVFLLSLPYTRCLLGGAFRAVHRVLYLAGVAGLAWHVMLLPRVLPKVLVFVACGLWVMSHCYRILACWRAVSVVERWSGRNITRLQLRTRRPVSTFPGSYFFLYLPGTYFSYNMLRSSAVMMLWTDPTQSISGRTTDFHILAGRQSRHLRLLRTVEEGDRMLLDGPYGQDLRLHEYETVILTAKGIGIVSVLPMALHLAARKNHDDVVRSQSNSDTVPNIGLATDLNAKPVFRDATRRVDLLWRLEHNDQELWVADQLKALQSLDPRHVMFLVWCIYPTSRTAAAPFQETAHWVAANPKPGQTAAEIEAEYSFEKALTHEVLLPGKSIVVACGDRSFTDERRASVIRNTTEKWPIEFVEAEYRPSGPSADPDLRTRAVSTRLRRRNRRATDGYDNVPLHAF